MSEKIRVCWRLGRGTRGAGPSDASVEAQFFGTYFSIGAHTHMSFARVSAYHTQLLGGRVGRTP